MAWTYIYLEEYSSAEKQLFLIKKDSLYQKPSQDLAGALKQLPHLPRKSPLMAGVLSAVIPGAGHFYMGTQCYHCDNPPCIEVCPVEATWKEKDGLV